MKWRGGLFSCRSTPIVCEPSSWHCNGTQLSFEGSGLIDLRRDAETNFPGPPPLQSHKSLARKANKMCKTPSAAAPQGATAQKPPPGPNLTGACIGVVTGTSSRFMGFSVQVLVGFWGSLLRGLWLFVSMVGPGRVWVTVDRASLGLGVQLHRFRFCRAWRWWVRWLQTARVEVCLRLSGAKAPDLDKGSLLWAASCTPPPEGKYTLRLL